MTINNSAEDDVTVSDVIALLKGGGVISEDENWVIENVQDPEGSLLEDFFVTIIFKRA